MSRNNKGQIIRNEFSSLPPRPAVDTLFYTIGHQSAQTADMHTLRHYMIPLFMLASALETAVGRFDQCVIERGDEMRDNLNDLQQTMHNLYSDYEQFCSDNRLHFLIDDAKPPVMERNAAYHNYIGGQGSYETLLDIARWHKNSGSLIERVMGRALGGRSEDEGLRWLIEQCKPMKKEYTWKGLADYWYKKLTAQQPEQGTIEASALRWLQSQQAGGRGNNLRKRANELGFR